MSGFTQFVGAVAGQVASRLIMNKVASVGLGQNREPRPYDLPVLVPGGAEIDRQAGEDGVPSKGFTIPDWLFLTGYGALLWYAAKATTPTVDLPDLGDPEPETDLLFPGLKRELTHLDVEDSATSDDPVEACLERAGWQLERVDELRETIFKKEQVDLFTEPDPLTRSEGELLEAIETCMQKLEAQHGSLEAAGVGCSVCDGDDPGLLAGIVPLEYSVSIENAVKGLIEEGVRETHYLVSLSPIRTLVTPLQPAKGFPYVKITAQGNVTSYDSKGKTVAVPQQMTFLGGGTTGLGAVQREMFDPEQEELTLYPGPTAPKHMQAKEGPSWEPMDFWFHIPKGKKKPRFISQDEIATDRYYYETAEKEDRGKVYMIEAMSRFDARSKLEAQLKASGEYAKEYGQKQNKFTPWFQPTESGGGGYRIIPNIMAHPNGSLEAAGDDPNLGAVASAHKPPDYDAVNYEDFDNTKVLPLVYRGITDKEAASIADTGRILSTMEFSHSSEGTSYGQDYYTAEGYVNYGRTDPKKTGKPTYVLEIKSGAEMEVDPRDYYVKAEKPIPASRIKRAWKYNPDGTIEAVELRQGKWTTLASGSEADFLSGLGAVQREMFDPEQIEIDLPIAHKTVEQISSLYEYLDTLEPGEPANILDACTWILGSENCGAAQTDHPAGGVETVIHLVKHEGYYYLDDLRKAYKSGDKASIPQHRKTRYLGIAS